MNFNGYGLSLNDRTRPRPSRSNQFIAQGCRIKTYILQQFIFSSPRAFCRFLKSVGAVQPPSETSYFKSSEKTPK
jgi:hypothetical protein